MKVILFAAGICFSTIFTSCSKENNPAESDILNNTVIMPLKKGNQWRYKITHFNKDGAVTSTRNETWEIIKDTLISNETWFIMEVGEIDNIIITNRENGLWTKDTYSEFLLFKYPANVNDKFVRDDDNIKIISQNAQITVPGGNFSCYQYQTYWLDNEFTSNDYWAPDIGPVKFESYEVYWGSDGNSGHVTSRWELVSYTILR